ncbi:MAG: NAD-dependent epimerase/dehydratase family protein [Phycisphaerales bacterium]|nr:NAD-dependent epimerase/dehydratase family protein [Phycisphaerales bacterium]
MDARPPTEPLVRPASLPGFARDRLAGATCLVTGGAGFIGSHLVRALLACGSRVRVLDDLSTGHRHNLHADSEFIEGRVEDEATSCRAAQGCDLAFHLAAMVSVPQSVADPDACVRSNIVGTQRVLSACRDGGVRRVVLASTCAVYGDEPSLPSREGDPTACCSPYAASKLAGEALVQAMTRSTTPPSGGPTEPMSGVCLRFFNVFGPGQDPKSAYAAVISAFGSALLEGRTPTIFGDGRQSRDFVFVGDVVRANLLAATSPEAFRGEVLNVGTGRSTSLLELLAAMARLGDRPPQARHEPPRSGDVRHSRADIARIRERLGYEAATTLEEGLRATIDAMRVGASAA